MAELESARRELLDVFQVPDSNKVGITAVRSALTNLQEEFRTVLVPIEMEGLSYH
jgi:DNA-directed RNA polymerase specialized sigma24 family protein